MHPLALAPPAAPLPRRSEVEAFWNSFSCDRSIAVLQSVPAFLLQTPGGGPHRSGASRLMPQRFLIGSVETRPVACKPILISLECSILGGIASHCNRE
jgi:hypothetical protein